MKNIGLIINPIAGIGGRVGLKGSDGEKVQLLALQRGAEKESERKARIALELLQDEKDSITFFAAPKSMGEFLLKEMKFLVRVVGKIDTDQTTAIDTRKAAKEMEKLGVELILFAGGDGTAIDICEALGFNVPVIGIPTGVKIHSAVYANNPRNAGLAVAKFLKMKYKPTFVEAEVMDIDEELFRQGKVQAKLHGYLKIPLFKKMMQHPKEAIRYDENDITGIYFEIKERIEKDLNCFYVFGTGSTTYHIMQHMGLKGSLLGIDVIKNGKIMLCDATEKQLLALLENKKAKLIITVIGGQGHVFGRGNHQLSPKVIKMIGLDNLWIVANVEKIYHLINHTLYVDTSDLELDKELAGYKKIIIGYHEQLVCKVAY